jgi:predicted nucleic acid-binding protein
MSRRAYALHIAEPTSGYAQRPALVTDASVLAAVLFGEGALPETRALLLGRALHAPHLVDVEIASVALKKLRRGASAEAVTAALRAYGQLTIERHEVDAETVAVMARRCNLTAYDAAYLCVADELAAPLATLDDTLAEAARAYLSANREVHERH